MEITKATWASDGDITRLTMPISKVDAENRLVSGWASLDNLDSQDDVILPEANRNAFTRFRGNIREMHQPIAVGKMVDFREDVYYDTKTEKFYNGIFVTVYVSKGAQDTWEKVLDGTLQGFSIGGSILDAEPVFMKDIGKSVRVVKDYELVELSLVDSPANQLANVFSITKSTDGMVMKGMVTETATENVFYCSKHEGGVAKTSTEDSAVCPEGHLMENIGWFESDGGDKTEKVKVLVSNHLSSSVAKQAIPANNEGGVNVAEENTNPETEVVAGSTAPAVDAVVEEGKAESEVNASVNEASEEVVESTESEESSEEEAPVETEKAADVSEVEADEPDFAKMFGDLEGAITSGLEKTRSETEAAIVKATEAFESKISDLVVQHTELVTKFDSLKNELESVEKALNAVESETAVKKSGDLGGSTENTLSKSKGSRWGGFFLSTNDLS